MPANKADKALRNKRKRRSETPMKSDVLLKQELFMDSTTTLSCQIEHFIRQFVESGKLAPGDAIPTEEMFCNAYGISRSTIRVALKGLVDEGLLARVRGKGTFVAEQKMRRKIESVYSFTHEIESVGLVPSSRIVGFDLIQTPAGIAKILFGRQASAEKVFCISRIRMADNVPLLLETAYIPYNIFPSLTEEKLQNHSLYDLLRDEAGVIPAHAEECYESCLLDKSMCVLFNCPKNTTGFAIQRIAYDKDERIYEVTQSTMRGDRSKLVVSLEEDRVRMKRHMNETVDPDREL